MPLSSTVCGELPAAWLEGGLGEEERDSGADGQRCQLEDELVELAVQGTGQFGAADQPDVLAVLLLELLHLVHRVAGDQFVDYHLNAGLPGDRIGVALLYLAMLGLTVDDLTIPAILEPYSTDELIEQMVSRLLA